MKLKFCGAAGTTTGSQHLLEINGTRILLDCGLYQGRREESYDVNCKFPHFDPKEIDVVILSHAHIDHSGNLPNLCKQGFNGNIYSTFATRDLCQIMLADSAHIQEQDTEYLNRDRAKDGLPPVQPLYLKEDAERCLRQFVTMNYERPMPVADGVTVSFHDAGHILGAAQVLLEIVDKEDGNNKKRFLFSGDIGRGGNEILRDPAVVRDVDYVLMESTYGGREHELPTGATEEFGEMLNTALGRRGKVMIPAFAVERTQAILYIIHQLFRTGKVQPVPVYVDSPLAVNATEIFRIHPECFNETVYKFLFEETDPFLFPDLHLIRAVDDSKRLNDVDGPCIIISASGRRRPHPPSPEERSGRPAEYRPLRRLLRGEHPRPRHPGRPPGGEHLRQAGAGPRPHRGDRFLLRPRGSLRAVRLVPQDHGAEEERLARSWRTGACELSQGRIGK